MLSVILRFLILMNEPLHINVPDAAAMTGFGQRLGELLFPGAVVALNGNLGAGKTFLVRAISEGLEIADSRIVTSPTFVLIQEYSARLPIYHFDAYRLHSDAEFLDLGVEEYFFGTGVCLIEWAERVADSLPVEKLTIGITITSETARALDISGHGKEYELLLQQLANST